MTPPDTARDTAIDTGRDTGPETGPQPGPGAAAALGAATPDAAPVEDPAEVAARTVAVAADRGLPCETVTMVRHWTDRLFSFRTTRPRSLRFRSGEFVMIGLADAAGRPVLRAYSIASPAWDEELEFYSIKVQDGPLTSRLQHIREGDQIILKPKAVGTLVLDALLPGRRLWFFATGTGVAPYASLMRDPDTYERYDEVILMHTCRQVAELEYGRQLVEGLKDDPLCGEYAHKLRYYPTTTQEPSPRMGRITDNLTSGRVFADLGIPPIAPGTDRGMVCGSLEFNTDMKAILEGWGLREGANSEPAEYVVEKAFVG